MTGGAVSGPVILGGAGPELSLDRAGARRCGASALAYGWFEAGWLRTRVLELPVDGLPAELDGLRVAHLSDFHFGPVSRGTVAGRRAAEWVRVAPARPRRRHRRPALAPARPRDSSTRRSRASTPSSCSATTTSRSRATRSPAPPSSTGCRRRCWSTSRGRSSCAAVPVQVAGTAPRASGPVPAPDAAAAFRILLSHYPRLRAPGYQLVLAGPHARGPDRAPVSRRQDPLRAPPRADEPRGSTARAASPCTSRPVSARRFVPFRFFARPEVTELVLRSR